MRYIKTLRRTTTVSNALRRVRRSLKRFFLAFVAESLKRLGRRSRGLGSARSVGPRPRPRWRKDVLVSERSHPEKTTLRFRQADVFFTNGYSVSRLALPSFGRRYLKFGMGYTRTRSIMYPMSSRPGRIECSRRWGMVSIFDAQSSDWLAFSESSEESFAV